MTTSATTPGRDLKKPVEFPAVCARRAGRANDDEAAEEDGALAISRATILSSEAVSVGAFCRVPPGPAAAGSGTSATITASKVARGHMPRHDVILSVTSDASPLATSKDAARGS
jgi:hypothetical protein